MSPEVRAFVDDYKRRTLNKNKPKITIHQIIKDHNHEIWRVCQDCGAVFDLRKELDCKCPKCESRNVM